MLAAHSYVNIMEPKVERVLFTAEDIKRRVEELAVEIQTDYEGKDLAIISILRGSLIFLADLIRFLRMPLMIDVISAASYYGNTVSSGEVHIQGQLHIELRGVDVLLLDDILDTGRTLSKIKKHIEPLGPRDVKIAVLLDKPALRVTDISPDYCGFKIDNLFVVGYGLDYEHRFRNLPYIGVLATNSSETRYE